LPSLANVRVNGGRGRTVCGIVGLSFRTDRYQSALGELFVPMLGALATRGPDSAGIAVYSNQPSSSSWKYSLRAPKPGWPWDEVVAGLRRVSGEAVDLHQRGPDALVVSEMGVEALRGALAEVDPAISFFGFGRAMEVFKGVGEAGAVCRRYRLGQVSGYQAVGHTRMATESAVTIAHSHPFCPAPDLALVHNGSFSNYASVRRELEGGGIVCETDNDSEVAARFVAAEMSLGASLDEALRDVLKRFDGFFTLLAATADEFAIVRDSFACKPMVVAETADYVAVGSEFVALASLPGIDAARVFEPDPEEIYSWTTMF
jgi:methylamine---glutamate N-methyltransferase subunit A